MKIKVRFTSIIKFNSSEFETPLVLLCVLTYLRGLEVAELKEEDMPIV